MMPNIASTQLSVTVRERSQIGEARRAAARIAFGAKANELEAGRFAIVTTELATNILRHAQGGEILLQHLHLSSSRWLEVIAIDKGPGMASVDRCMADGYSTGDTSGNGLGAVMRQSDEFDIHSDLKEGTAAMARIRLNGRGVAEMDWAPSCGVVSIPYPGEIECGDGWRVAWAEDCCSCIVVDGLGHGSEAAKAARAAAGAYEANPLSAPSIILGDAHIRMRGTRGGAAAISQIDYRRGMVRHAGVGNISATVLSGDSERGLISHNGIVGLNAHKIQELEYPWSLDCILVMCSDGLQSRWQLVPGLRHRHPALIAAVLFRDYRRGTDDVTVLVISPARPGGWAWAKN